MEREYIKLWDNGTPYYDPDFGQPETTVTPYLAEGEGKRGCVIVFPGGGYAMRAEHEGEPIAKMLNEIGVHAFVLNYRVAPYKHPAELEDALRAIRWVRYHAEKYNIDPDKIGILGFSAGGHLAVSASTHFDYGRPGGDAIDAMSSKPNAAIYCYAVCTLERPYTHIGSRNNLLGENASPELVKQMSGPDAVREDMPPVFIWHTFEDTCVPVQNSVLMAMALREKSIPVEMHIVPHGSHGLGLAPALPHVAQWAPLLQTWLKYNNF
ncbi:MAG: alpha/beta hydrolase [Clostridia bacterium]|nr:alpha/beta hydrolase [Clostridia bacterium]